MMNERYKKFLEKLIIKTKSRYIMWDLFDSDPESKRSLRFTDGKFLNEGTYISRFGNIRIILYGGTNALDSYMLEVIALPITQTSNSCILLQENDYSELLVRLYSIISNQLYDTEGFVDSLCVE